MHSSSPSDELQIKVILKQPCPESEAGNLDEEFLIGLTTLNIADVSYFLHQSPYKL